MLTIISCITLLFTFSLSFSFMLLRDKSFFGIKISPGINFFPQPLLNVCLIFALFLYRSICQLPNYIFNAYILANASIMLNFIATRFHVISLSNTGLTWNIYLEFFFVFLMSTTFGLVRFCFNLGFQIDQNPHVVLVLLERLTQSSANFFTTIGRRISGQMPASPGSSGADKQFALGVGVFVATGIGAGSGVYLGYEAYQTRMLNTRVAAEAAEASAKAAEASAKAAETSAKIAQQKNDLRAVKQDLMSKEEYWKKYSKDIPK